MCCQKSNLNKKSISRNFLPALGFVDPLVTFPNADEKNDEPDVFAMALLAVWAVFDQALLKNDPKYFDVVCGCSGSCWDSWTSEVWPKK